MVNIYKIKVNPLMNNKTFEYLFELISDEKRNKIKKFRFKEDAFRCLLGDILSRYAIIKRTGYKNRQLEFSVNTYNKPILIQPYKLNFNISHSGNWAVCATSEAPVGIDVELIKAIDFGFSNRFFTDYEYSCLMKQDPVNQLKYFYTIWTLKESYIKADGRGLSLALDSFSISLLNDKITLITNNDLSCCFFRTFSIDERHVVSVCSLTNNIANNIEEVTVDDLLQLL